MSFEYGRGLVTAPDDTGTPQFCWLHVAPGDTMELVMAEVLPLWYYAHWMEGRMRPCSGSGCSWCEMGVGRQRRWVFAVIEAFRKKAFLWEVSEYSCAQIKAIAQQQDSPPYMKILVARQAGNRKGRLEIRHSGTGDPLFFKDIQFPDLAEALELTWAFSRGHENMHSGAAPSRDLGLVHSRERLGEY